MGGGLMQLVAYGAQDIYLTGNPQITFFKVVYRRHTNFSMEAIEQTWSGTAPSSGDGRCTATISRNGDLVHDMFILLEGTLGATACDNPGAYGIDHVTLEIGGQQIDKHFGHWLETWAELTQENDLGVTSASGASETVVSAMQTEWQGLTCSGGVSKGAAPSGSVYIPLQFWFCRNPGLSLPLIALQYHEVKVILEHKLNTAFAATFGGNSSLFCNYIYLDTDERRRFAQVSHEYLIEQVQHQTTSADLSKDLNFNHPVKELIWTGEMANIVGTSGYDRAFVPDAKWNIKLNGHDRMTPMPADYFTRYQVFKYHTGCGGLGELIGGEFSSSVQGGEICKFNDSIAVYSFAIKPEEHQPSGTCNFSRIDTAKLVQSTGGAVMEVYAINYNVLRIMSGMGGLAYSN
jgi:hypothetical protein